MSEEQTPENVNTIEDLVQYSLAQDYNKANEIFGNVITTKLSDVLDQEKIKLAGQIYNDEPAEEEEPEEEDFEEDESEEDEEESEEESEEDEEDEEESEDESV